MVASWYFTGGFTSGRPAGSAFIPRVHALGWVQRSISRTPLILSYVFISWRLIDGWILYLGFWFSLTQTLAWNFICRSMTYILWSSDYAPNFEEVDRAYWFRVVRPPVHQEPCMLGFWNFIYDSSWKNSWHTVFSWPGYLPFWSYAPLEKSEWNLMHAISYEPCMLGFWNFIYGFLMEK